MSKPQLMKNGLGINAIKRISTVLVAVIDDFPEQKFIEEAWDQVEDLELRQRVDCLIDILARYLPADFNDAAEILLQIKNHWDYGVQGDALGRFAAWPLIDYVAKYGLDYPQKSLAVLKQLTSLFTAEFAIRPFINQHFTSTYSHLIKWSCDPDEHVRRLASEGIRPLLPWGKQLVQFREDPQPVIELIERLKDDPSEYVRRSVANNLNDISKDHPDKVIRLCKNWLAEATDERKWIIRHGCRSLLKQSDPTVFTLLGFTHNPQFQLERFEVVNKQLKLGESLEYLLLVRNTAAVEQHWMIDYKIHHVKSNGHRTNKVFKLKTIKIKANATVEIVKKHSFRIITTRKYYSGIHTLEILMNGKGVAKVDFYLGV